MSGRKEEGGKNEAAFTTLIYFFSFYNMEVQLTRKWHLHHKLWRKKIVLVTGLRKGRGKEFGRRLVRVRGRNNKGPIPFSLSPPQLKSLPFPFRKPAAQAKEKIANVRNYQLCPLLLRKYLKNMWTCRAQIREVDVPTTLEFDPRFHDLQVPVICVHGRIKTIFCLTVWQGTI